MDARPDFRPASSAKRACALFGSVALVGAGVFLASPAQADPAALPDPLTWGQTSPGAFQVTVPDGICGVQAQIAGGAGNNQVSGAPDEAGGQGALIDVAFSVTSGQTLSGTVGAAAGSSTGAAPGGGSGGSGPGHNGGGGGGYTDLLRNSDLLALAGGGGGSGGGHAPTEGWGGDAGVPTGTGVFSGQNGSAGQDSSNGTVGGGQGGQTGGPGAGGVHSTDPSMSGLPGTGRDGGSGGTDTDLDTGAGGGGGFYGGGGGASTVGNGGTIGGAGGGGGASYVSGGFVNGGLNAVGAGGSVNITWVPCAYDLAIAKSAKPGKTYPNKPVTYTVKVTNLGTDPMGGGDTVTITDPNAEGATIKSVKTTGSNDMTCTPGVGGTIDGTGIIECSRPLTGSTSGVRGLDVDEVLTITYSKEYTELGTVENTASITDRGDPSNNSATASVRIVAQPLPDTGRDQVSAGGISPLTGLGGAGALLGVAALAGWAAHRRGNVA